MEQNTTQQTTEFDKRILRTQAAVELREPDSIPIIPFTASILQNLFGACYKDVYYDYRKAGEAAVKFFETYMPDAAVFIGFTSGKANELAGSSMIDWPGRPGTKVPDFSSHQVIEREFLLPEEYPELLNDYDGFMLRKYVPRAYPNLAGLAKISFTPTVVTNTNLLAPMYSPDALKAYEILAEIAKADAAAAALGAEYNARISALGIPPFISGMSQAPYDILGDYFRGTMGMFDDLMEREDEIEAACEMFANQQIAALQYFRFVPMPVKRVFFPLHKAMDGFMSPKQYERLYWKPLKKIMMALIDMGVTPLIYTEGRYDTRVEQLADVPKGKVIYHFETVDMARAKKLLGDVACISGNLPHYLLEFGTSEKVADYCKYLIDTCGPGGGYIFDTDASIDKAKRENIDIMFDTMRTYGKY